MKTWIIDERFEIDVPDGMERTDEETTRWVRLAQPGTENFLEFSWRTPEDSPIMSDINRQNVEEVMLAFVEAELSECVTLPEEQKAPFARGLKTYFIDSEEWSWAKTSGPMPDGIAYMMYVVFHHNSHYLWQFRSHGTRNFNAEIVRPTVKSLRVKTA